jgi:hypothetical protein
MNHLDTSACSESSEYDYFAISILQYLQLHPEIVFLPSA